MDSGERGTENPFGAGFSGGSVYIPEILRGTLSDEDVAEILSGAAILGQDIFEHSKMEGEDNLNVCKDFALQSILSMYLFAHKHHDYGFGNIARKGSRGILVRMGDKQARLEELQGKEGKAESKGDTLADLQVYPGIAILTETGRWKGAKQEDNI